MSTKSSLSYSGDLHLYYDWNDDCFYLHVNKDLTVLNKADVMLLKSDIQKWLDSHKEIE